MTILRATVSLNSAHGGTGGPGSNLVTFPGAGGSGGAGEAGGLYSFGASTLSDSTISANTARGGTGGRGGSSSSGIGAVGGRGGGGLGGGVVTGGGLTFTNTTISRNSVRGGDGGNGGDGSPRGGNGGNGGTSVSGGGHVGGGSNLALSSTVAYNQAEASQGGADGRGANPGIGQPGQGGGGSRDAGTLHARNTIFGNNSAASHPDFSGDFASASYNLLGDGTGSNLADGVNGNRVGSAITPLDPVLGPLQDNGGNTLTHALLPGSPAIDAGDNTDAPAFDQRGFARIANGTIDIGAFEFQAATSGPRIIAQSLTRTAGPVSSLRVTFDRAMDVASFTPDKIPFFSGPLGAIPVTAVIVVPDTDDRQFDIHFPAQVVTSLYGMVIGPYIVDTAGIPMDQDSQGPPGESGDAYLASFGITGPRVTASSPSGTVGGPVDRVRLTFSVPMDPATFEAPDILEWVGPLGTIVVGHIEAVAGSGNTQFDIYPTSPLSAAGSYTLLLWPDVRDVWGNPLDQNDNLIGGEGYDDGYVAAFAIADAGPSGGSTWATGLSLPNLAELPFTNSLLAGAYHELPRPILSDTMVLKERESVRRVLSSTLEPAFFEPPAIRPASLEMDFWVELLSGLLTEGLTK